jgi:3-hydroxyisobutyrate dehydrogenase-like beta-hydroxyacid dehydrogenase
MVDQKTGKDTIAILGLGKVGTAVGYLLKTAGYHVVAVASRSRSSLYQGVAYTGGKPCMSFVDAASQAECIFITTIDDAIVSTCEKITK